jgi:hypothetical protein
MNIFIKISFLKKTICILFVLLSFGKCLQAQTIDTIDSLNKIKQACLDEGRGMVGCVVTFENQMDSLITLSLQKLYAKGSRASNLALENDQKNWLAKRKIYYKKAIKNGHADAIKGGWNGGSMENLLIAGDITNFVERRAEVLIKKLNKQKI